MLDRSLLRGGAIFVAWLLGPIGLLFGLARAGMGAAMGPLLPLLFIIYPHDWFVHRSGYSSAPVFSSSTAALVAIAQWALVTIEFAVLTRRLSASRQAWLAPVIVVGIGIAVLVLTSLFGITIEADWL